jgi:hypothetical protein
MLRTYFRFTGVGIVGIRRGDEPICLHWMSRSTCSPRRSLSQERLARDLGVDWGNLASLERGLHTPTFYTIVRLLPGSRACTSLLWSSAGRSNAS